MTLRGHVFSVTVRIHSYHQMSSYIPTLSKVLSKRLRWSKGSVLPLSTQVRGFEPGRSRQDFSGQKILSAPSFRGEVKPSAPCRRFPACKRSLNGTWKSSFRQNYRPFILAQTVPPFAARGLSGSTDEATDWEWNVGTSKIQARYKGSTISLQAAVHLGHRPRALKTKKLRVLPK
jgi:hypothetical protein